MTASTGAPQAHQAQGRRRVRRRGGFAGHAEALREMRAVLDGELRGVYENRRTKVAS
ncbi:hypothetical protein ACWC5I_09050 [Kitasatospora sp. NPDC001574]